MGMKKFLLYVKIIGDRRVFVLREICMNTPVYPRLRHSKELLVAESESLEDIKKSIEKINLDLLEDSFCLVFDCSKYKPRIWVRKLFNALEKEEIKEEIKILGKITEKEKKELKPLFETTISA